MSEGSPKQSIVDKIQDVETVLVTVSSNPSVDELSAALALTIFLNDIDKHATSVVSGDIPPAIKFLEPEKTFEGSVDSLRDFVIALDKEKADHLRYKVEGDVVKIFITPYNTVITSDDLEYSQGDYNVEMIIALGVNKQDNLDKALEAHGRILHDATVATIGLEPSQLGSIDYNYQDTSSLSELVSSIIYELESEEHKVSEQVANALLTGIVSATDRFSNENTTSSVMNVAAKLMGAGANQQLIASNLQGGTNEKTRPSSNDGNNKSTNKSKKSKKNRNFSIDHGTDKNDKGSNGNNSSETLEDIENNQKKTNSDDPDKLFTSETTQPSLSKAHKDEDDSNAPKQSKNDEEAKSDEALNISDRPPESKKDEKSEPDFRPKDTPKEEPVSKNNSPENTLDQALSQNVDSKPNNIAQDDLAAQLKEAANQANSQQDVKKVVDEDISKNTQNEVSSSRTDEHSEDKPGFGGVLNATTEQAAEDKRRAIEEDRNKTILTHGASSGREEAVKGLGSSPMNSYESDGEVENSVNPLAEDTNKSVELPSVESNFSKVSQMSPSFSQPSTMNNSNNDPILSNDPVSSAMQAAQDAHGAEAMPTPPPPPPSPASLPQNMQPQSDIPLPPPPPLPPLSQPSNDPAPHNNQEYQAGIPTGAGQQQTNGGVAMPPPPRENVSNSPTPTSSPPGQFKIPGQ